MKKIVFQINLVLEIVKAFFRFKFQIKWKKRKKNVNGNAFQTTWKYTDDLKRIAVYGERPNG